MADYRKCCMLLTEVDAISIYLWFICSGGG